jgi:hypothetical protein
MTLNNRSIFLHRLNAQHTKRTAKLANSQYLHTTHSIQIQRRKFCITFLDFLLKRKTRDESLTGLGKKEGSDFLARDKNIIECKKLEGA